MPTFAPRSSNVGYFVTSVLSEHESLRRENVDRRAQLAVDRQHADPIAAAIIADLQQRYEREHQADTRKVVNTMCEAWNEFRFHSAALNSRLHDTRREVARVMPKPVGYAQPPPTPRIVTAAGPAARIAGLAADYQFLQHARDVTASSSFDAYAPAAHQ